MRWKAWLRRQKLQVPAASAGLHLGFGHEFIPSRTEYAHGGIVKFQHLVDRFGYDSRNFNLLYMVSSNVAPYSEQLLKKAKKKGVKFAWNQNGVNYPGSAGFHYEESNKAMAHFLHSADYVFYQSDFCKQSAWEFLGKPKAAGEILYNSVDTKKLVPIIPSSPRRPLTLLAAGTVNRWYRLEVALKTLALVRETVRDAKLIVAGELSWEPSAEKRNLQIGTTLRSLGLSEAVTFSGTYTQAETVSLFARADLLLHTKYNDPCPGVVIEAMSCGLPVVYSKSGGVPELVGDKAGIGVETEISWEEIIPPDVDGMANAVLEVAKNLELYQTNARHRAIEKFDIAHWLARHAEVFATLLED